MEHPKLLKILLLLTITLLLYKLSNAQIECTFLLEPENQSTDVIISTDLTWQASDGATGYILRVGITSGGGEILDDVDVGNVTTYDPGDFPCGSTIYVTITPYDGINTPPLCDEESFETEYVVAEAGNDQNICEGEGAQLNASGGSIYSWEPPESLDDPNIPNPVASPLETTVYNVTVTNESGCFDVDYVTVYVNPNPYANASATDETCYQCNDGTATANPSGGTPEYWYEWSTGEYTQTIINLSPGYYSVTVGDENDCYSVETVSVYEFICPDLIIEDQYQDACYNLCDGYINIYNLINVVYPCTYYWSNGETTSSIYDLCPGDYSVTVTDAVNCTVTKDYTINENPEVIPNASATDETCYQCNDGTATANPSGGTPEYWYEWSTGEYTQTITNLSPGDYSVTVGDENDCYSVETVSVYEFICPTLIIEDQYQDACYNLCDGYINIYNLINVVYPCTYYWSNGETTSSIYDLCPGNYSVTVTDAVNCTVTKDYTINENPEVIPNASATDETCYQCNDGTATANPSGGTPPYLYQWSNGDTTQTILNLTPGSYSVTIQDGSYCEVYDTVVVEEFICPQLIIQDDMNDACYDECTGFISINDVTNGIAPFEYLWSNGAITEGIYSLCSGNYSVTVTDSKNCSTTKNYTVTELTQIIPNASKTDETCNACNDGTASTNPSGGNPPYWYQWSNGDTTQTISNLTPGNYTVTVGDVNECYTIETITVSQFGCPDMVIQDETSNVQCYGACNGSITILGVSNTSGTLLYQWSTGSSDSSISGLCPGNYSVTVTDVSINCSTNKTYSITEPSILSNTLTKTDESCTNCNDGTISATPDGGTPPYWYQWSNGESTQTISNLSPGEYMVTVGDVNECYVIDTAIITQYNCPQMVIQDSIQNVSCYGDCNGVIIINNITNTIGTLMYQWSNGSSNSGIFALCAGNYSVTVTDVSNNCSVTKSYTITQPDDIIITIDNKTNPTESSKGKIDISTNNDGTYTFTWTGPNGFTSSTEDIDNLTEGCYSLIIANDNDCSKDTTICLEKETAVFDLKGKNNVYLYPNPTSDLFYIDFPKINLNTINISILDVSGNKIYHSLIHKKDNIYIIDVSNIDTGLYFVKIESEKGILFKKLIINR